MKYEIFSHKIVSEGEAVDTYGITATDTQGNKSTFEDVTTFQNKLEWFVDFLNEENISLKGFKFLLEHFMESL
jgi:hypothetical protein